MIEDVNHRLVFATAFGPLPAGAQTGRRKEWAPTGIAPVAKHDGKQQNRHVFLGEAFAHDAGPDDGGKLTSLPLLGSRQDSFR
jgi:hypothetical protein